MNIVIRCDANKERGIGHLKRCSVVADELCSRGHKVRIVSKVEGSELVTYSFGDRSTLRSLGYISNQSFISADAALTKKEADVFGASIVLVDSYDLGEEWERIVMGSGINIFAIDDEPLRPHIAECVICPGPWGGESIVRTIHGKSKYIGGTELALIQKEYRQVERDVEKDSWLICLGGSACSDKLILLLGALEESRAPVKRCRVICNNEDAGYKQLMEIASTKEWLEVEGLRDSLKDVYSNVEYAIGACGVMALERRACGIHSLSIKLSQNQDHIARLLRKEEDAVVVDWEEVTDERSLVRYIRLLVDSNRVRSASREDARGHNIVCELIELKGTDQVVGIREVAKSDCHLLYELANDSCVRSSAFRGDMIRWEEHCEWFDKKLDEGAVMLIGETHSGVPLGQVRFDVIKETAFSLDYSLASYARGKALGSKLVSAALEYLDSLLGSEDWTVVADVKGDNYASRRVLERVGFEVSTTDELVVGVYRMIKGLSV